MIPEALHRAITVIPFRPFTIVMTSGTKLPIWQREMIAHAETARTAIVMYSDRNIQWVDLSLISQINFEVPDPREMLSRGSLLRDSRNESPLDQST